MCVSFPPATFNCIDGTKRWRGGSRVVVFPSETREEQRSQKCIPGRDYNDWTENLCWVRGRERTTGWWKTETSASNQDRITGARFLLLLEQLENQRGVQDSVSWEKINKWGEPYKCPSILPRVSRTEHKQKDPKQPGGFTKFRRQEFRVWGGQGDENAWHRVSEKRELHTQGALEICRGLHSSLWLLNIDLYMWVRKLSETGEIIIWKE